VSRFLKVDPEKNYGRGYDRWVYCRFCGALNDLEKRTTGDGEGFYFVDKATFNGEPLKYDPTASRSLALTGKSVILKLDADGNGKTFHYTPRNQVNSSGCFFCGSRNFI